MLWHKMHNFHGFGANSRLASALIILIPAGLIMLLLLLVIACDFISRQFSRSIKEPAVTNSADPLLESNLSRFKKTTMSILNLGGWLVLWIMVAATILLYFLARRYLVYQSFGTVFTLPREAYAATSVAAVSSAYQLSNGLFPSRHK